VEQGLEAQLGRELHRQEAVVLDAEVGEVAAVGDAGEQHRDRVAGRVGVAEEPCQQRIQGPVHIRVVRLEQRDLGAHPGRE
jgi:hypothetical protein